MHLTFTLHPKQSAVYNSLYMLAGMFPLTLQGTITLLVAALTLSVFGYGSLDLVVFALSICALSILIFSLFCAVISGILIQRRVQRLITEAEGSAQAIEVEAGYPNETGFSLPAVTYFPLVKLSWRVSYPDYMETRIRVSPDNRLIEELIPQKRCLTTEVIRQFTVSDVLGFCRYSWQQKQTIRCKALPMTKSVKPLPLLRSLTAEDGIPNPIGDPEGDRMEIRPYAPGDSVRNIMWKVYARNRQLNVRLAEKSVFHSRRTVAYLLSSENDEAAAAVARIALESGALGDDWAFAADGTEQPCETLSGALEAVARSRAIKSSYSYGLDTFLQQAGAQTGCHCIVFAAAEQAPWLSQLRHTISHFPGQFSVVMALDGFGDRRRKSGWRRLMLREPANSAPATSQPHSRQELLELLTDVGQLVESMLIVDRKTGFSFDKQLRKV
jgi:hypothetical protein